MWSDLGISHVSWLSFGVVCNKVLPINAAVLDTPALLAAPAATNNNNNMNEMTRECLVRQTRSIHCANDKPLAQGRKTRPKQDNTRTNVPTLPIHIQDAAVVNG